mmetsp:Transcript_7414/g.19214  ORF Transcript_7414/g.19214 Transcript_7414/m.19214 type:complete len:111 (-) Transcript_7414:322-654(-)
MEKVLPLKTYIPRIGNTVNLRFDKPLDFSPLVHHFNKRLEAEVEAAKRDNKGKSEDAMCQVYLSISTKLSDELHTAITSVLQTKLEESKAKLYLPRSEEGQGSSPAITAA